MRRRFETSSISSKLTNFILHSRGGQRAARGPHAAHCHFLFGPSSSDYFILNRVL